MHIHVLNPNQAEILPYLSVFRRKFYLVGGTAIALHLGHRRSIDFDLFTPAPLVKSRVKMKLKELPFTQAPLFEDIDFSEPVDFMVKEIPENEIKEFLIGKAISFL